MATISVLMSVYKSEKPEYFDRALRSVWTDQTVMPNQIVLIKDGPLGPELDKIVTKWQSELGDKMRIICNPENLGLTKSLNEAIQAATGDYFARMDSDDVSLPNRFADQLRYMERHPEVVVLGGAVQEIDENDNPGEIRIYPADMPQIRKYIVKANPINHPTAFLRASIFKEGFGYDEEYQKNQDLKLWYDILAAGHVINNIPETVLNFRRTSETYRKRSTKITLRNEYDIYSKGIRRLYGPCNWRQIYPLVRVLVKSSSPQITEFIYRYLFRKRAR